MTTATVPEKVQKEVMEFQARADKIVALEVKDQESFELAAAELRWLSSAEKRVKDTRLELVRPFNDAVKALNGFFKKFEDGFANAKRVVGRKMSDYSNEQERIRREQEAKLRDLQRKEAEKLEKKAEKLENSGKLEQAEVAREQAVQASLMQPTVIVESGRAEGVKKTIRWTFDIINPDEVPVRFCSPDPKKIREAVSALKENCKIPGVRVYSEESFSSTGR